MLLGNKIQNNALQMGIKKNTGIQYLGNKISSESNRRILKTSAPNTVVRNSPIEKYRVNNY